MEQHIAQSGMQIPASTIFSAIGALVGAIVFLFFTIQKCRDKCDERIANALAQQQKLIDELLARLRAL